MTVEANEQCPEECQDGTDKCRSHCVQEEEAMTMHTPFQLGSISTGTLRTEDLLTAYADRLDYFDCHKFYVSEGPTSIKLYHPRPLVTNAYAARDLLQNETGDTKDIVGNILEDLTNALNDLCPPFVYFGAHPGDGADFGFWPDLDDLNEAVRLASHYQGKTASEGLWLPDDNVIVQISDHGNITVMDMDRNIIWTTV